MNPWKNFRQNKYYLTTYLLLHAVAMSAILFFWFKIKGLPAWDITFSPWMLALLLPALILSIQIPVLIHNCVHRNLRPQWLNFVAGELAGLYVLLSMAAFELNHIMHHAHADTELDPHNPYQKTFFQFYWANNFGGTQVVRYKYLKLHGDTTFNRLLFQLAILLHFFNVPLRLLFWLFLLGPSLLIFVFLPSYLFHIFVFSHINYTTHETGEDGQAAIYNLDSNLYYKLVNYFGSGVYYHKNHHQMPGCYNPKKGPRQNSWILK